MNEDDWGKTKAKWESLRPGQQQRVRQLLDSLVDGCRFTAAEDSDVVTAEFCSEFGDLPKTAPQREQEPFTKDKFEYAMVTAYNEVGRLATKSPMGNPGQ